MPPSVTRAVASRSEHVGGTTSPGADPEIRSTFAHSHFKKHCIELIAQCDYRSVCEVGGGRTPLLTPQDARKLGIEYTVLDASAEELAHAPPEFGQIHGDICSLDETALRPRFDFVFSRMVAEHVADGRAMHRAVFHLLRPGGRAFHFFPTLFSPAFVLNRLMPHRLSRELLRRVSPGRVYMQFPARYSWCYGPTARMHSRFCEIGFEVEEYRPFYGTRYLERIPIVRAADRALTNWAARSRNPYLTSFVWVVLRAPERGARSQIDATHCPSG